MTAQQQRAEIQLRAVTLYRDLIEEEAQRTNSKGEPLLSILNAYLDDQKRHANGVFPTLEEFIELKKAIVAAMDLLWSLTFDRSQEMAGWRQGVHPRNETQRLANIVTEIATDLARTTQHVERCLPELAAGFDRIRERQYAELPLLPSIH